MQSTIKLKISEMKWAREIFFFFLRNFLEYTRSEIKTKRKYFIWGEETIMIIANITECYDSLLIYVSSFDPDKWLCEISLFITLILWQESKAQWD